MRGGYRIMFGFIWIMMRSEFEFVEFFFSFFWGATLRKLMGCGTLAAFGWRVGDRA